MNKAIVSLALIKVNWEAHRDYLDTFVPFIATLIKQKNVKEISVKELCEGFKTEFGLIIPHHPMIMITNRAREKGLLTRSKGGRCVPVKQKVDELDFTGLSTEQISKYEKIITTFIAYIGETFGAELDRGTAESAFATFLKDHDLEIFEAKQSTVLPEVQGLNSSRRKFFAYKFIKYAHEAEPEIFRYIVDIAVGNALANALLYDEIELFRGNLARVQYYFDTRFILRLIGLEGEERKDAYNEFTKILLKEGGKLYLFQHTYEETLDILRDCERWVENPRYNPSLASPALVYFVQNNFSKSDVARFIANLKQTLQGHKINIVETPRPDEHKYYQIEEEKLYQSIVDTYKQKFPAFNESERALALRRDVKSISAIYKLRRGRVPHMVEEAGSIFVTTNFGLAYACKKFERSEMDFSSSIPACLTDIFIGTMVWLQSPARTTAINEKKLIADCYAALQPTDTLIKKFCNEVERLKREKKISKDEYYLLRTYKVASNLLEEKTMGDSDTFTGETAEEILEEIKERLRKEAEETYSAKYLEESKLHSETKDKLANTEEEKVRATSEKFELEKSLELSAERIATKLINAYMAVLVALVIALLVSPIFLADGVLRILLQVLAIVPGVLGIINGANIKGYGDKLKARFKHIIINSLRGKSTK